LFSTANESRHCWGVCPIADTAVSQQAKASPILLIVISTLCVSFVTVDKNANHHQDDDGSDFKPLHISLLFCFETKGTKIF
jgi:hypothetical protein